MPTARSLPYAAVMMWVVKMCWIGEVGAGQRQTARGHCSPCGCPPPLSLLPLSQDPIHITATIMQGALLALTPLAILYSAFVFFNALQVTQVRVASARQLG